MSITLQPVQGPFIASSATTSASFTASLTNTPTNGNSIILVYYSVGDVSDPLITSITQPGVTWTQALSVTGTPQIWIGLVGPGASKLMTININTPGNTNVLEEAQYAEWGGTFAVDQTNSSTGYQSNNPTSTGSVTTTVANELLIALVGTFASNNGVTQSTPQNGFTQFDGFTQVQQGANSNYATVTLLYEVVTVIGSYSSGTTFAGTLANWSAAIVSFIQTAPPLPTVSFIGDGFTFYPV